MLNSFKSVASHALILIEESGHSEINNIDNICRNKCQGNRKSGLNFYIFDLGQEERKQQG